MRYAILEDNMPRLEKKLARIENKCKKFGCEFKFEVVDEDYREVELEDGNTVTLKYIIVDVEGTAIVNGWKFVASVDYMPNGNVIHTFGEDIPKRYYNERPICEHCHTKRFRKYTYIVKNEETGEFRQVGKSCLAEYTGGLSAEMVTAYISFFDTLLVGETPMNGVRYEPTFPLDEILKISAECVRKFGYVARGEAHCTADRVWDIYCYKHGKLPSIFREGVKRDMDAVEYDCDSAEVAEIVAKSMEWVKESTSETNYMHNLKVLMEGSWVKEIHFSIIASMFKSYGKHIERMERDEALKASREALKDSVHVGNIGDRITVDVDSFRVITSWNNEWGVCMVYEIIGKDNNVYTWKTSKYLDEDIKTIRATVKEHKEWQGIKQTEITRGKCS